MLPIGIDELSMDIDVLSCASTADLNTPFVPTVRNEPIAKALMIVNIKYLFIVTSFKIYYIIISYNK